MSQTYVLIDLDNISFYESKHNIECLKARLKTLFSKFPRARFAFFSNVTTKALLEAEEVSKHAFANIIPFIRTSADAKDSADHALLDSALELLKSDTKLSRVVVVTSDKTLGRLVTYFWAASTTMLSFVTFKNTEGPCAKMTEHDQHRFPLHFNDRSELDAFISSLDIFFKRYPGRIHNTLKVEGHRSKQAFYRFTLSKLAF